MGSEPMLYFNEFSCPSRKVLIALYEKRVDFVRKELNLIKGDQLEPWYLETVNPKGEVPVLKHGEKIIPESTVILEYIDKHLGRPYLLYPVEKEKVIKELIAKIDSIPMVILTYGTICFQLENGVTNKLRHPYSGYDLRKLKSFFLTRPSVLSEVEARHQGCSEICSVMEKKSFCLMSPPTARHSSKSLWATFTARTTSASVVSGT